MSELEQDARIALLAHFSSKSTNEAIILLSEAVAFFTFVGLLYPSNFSNFSNRLDLMIRVDLMIVALGIFACLASYALGKLIYYGEYATAILSVEMSKINDALNQMEIIKGGLGLPGPIRFPTGDVYLDLLPTRLDRFTVACAAYFRAKRDKEKIDYS
jgi:hypothetical protein